ncbi:uncharacterized protein LOC135137884 isoform X2 [Zophobas morio]|uniref:uncharacterized protein LOC135137884 isoform X2 n=1 Tax=Zophobas morio TaxID=2755281 RepID=UPI003082F4BC
MQYNKNYFPFNLLKSTHDGTAFPSEDPAYSIEKNFGKRPRTMEPGAEYNTMITANIALNMISMDEVKNFHISPNHEHFGNFNNIVIEVGTEQIETTVQLKYNSGEDFSLLKYFKSFQEIENKPEQLILLTNLKMNLGSTKIQLDTGEYSVEHYDVKIADNNCFKMSQRTTCYKFRIIEDQNSRNEFSKVQQFETFLERFTLYTNQEDMAEVEKSTASKFVKMFSSDGETFEKYVKILSEWDVPQRLDKKMVQRVVALCLLSPYVENRTFGAVSDKGKILLQATCLFDITLLEKGGESDGTSDLELVQLLQLMEKRPLVVKEHENIEKGVQMCPDSKFVIVGEGKRRQWMKHSLVFQNLFDLKLKHELVYEKVMEAFGVSLQGKAVLTLSEACRGSDDILKNITVGNLVEMIDNPGLIGGNKETLPDPYIQRYLSADVIDTKYLDTVYSNCVFIVNCADSSRVIDKPKHHTLTDIDDYLNQPDWATSNMAVVIVSKNNCSQSEFDKVCSKARESHTVHYFKFLGDNSLEWVGSRGEVDELQKFKLGCRCKHENEFWAFKFTKRINLVLGDSGIGKTELIKNLKNNCSSKYWTVIVSPQDANLFFKESQKCDASDYLNLFQTFILKKYHYLGKLDKEFFKLCCEEFRVCYVWDAVDEVSAKYLEDVADLIVLLSNRGFMQWVTARKHLKSLLEKKFNTLSLGISRFEESEEDDYIRKRLSPIISDTESVIRKVKSSFALIEHVDIAGIPLQMFMLTELVRLNRDKYLKLFNNSWRLTDLYYCFIDIQNKSVTDKENHERLAVDLLFSDCANLNTPVFLHASFAEYLAAAYFSKNVELIPDRFFEPKYDNVRFFFDMLLAKPVHVAVLYRHFDTLKSYDDEMLTSKDGGGRSALHLICSWGRRHSRLNVTTSKIGNIFSRFASVLRGKLSSAKRNPSEKYTLDDGDETSEEELETRDYLDGVVYLLNKCGTSEPDGLFQMTPLSYARVSESLGAELELLHLYGYDNTIQMVVTKELPTLCQEVNCSTKSGCTPLALASSRGHTAVAQYLLQCQAEVNHPDKHGQTPLHSACSNDHEESAKCLIKFGAALNHPDIVDWTPLYVACLNGHQKTTQFLIQSGVDINRPDENGWTPLHTASSNGHKEIVERLVKSGAEINRGNSFGLTPLHYASLNGHENTVQYLVESGAEINCAANDGWTPLSWASGNGHEKVVEYLAKSGANVNSLDSDGRTPLYAASCWGHKKSVECLARFGAETNHPAKNGWTPLFAASWNGDEEVVDCLVNLGAVINLTNQDGRTALHAASKNGHDKIVEGLVKLGAEIDGADGYGWTPLFTALENDHESTVECLVRLGADVNRADGHGRTPIYVASCYGHEKSVRCLVKFGAGVNRGNDKGRTPIYAAARNGHEKTVECLVELGAEVNRCDGRGRTPFYVAARNGHEKTVECLVKLGAESCHVDTDD